MRDIPRGKGYDKVSITKHLAKYKAEAWSNGNAYARAHKLNPDFFSRALDKYIPDDWSPTFLLNKCEYCKREFAYSIKTQRFCDRKCASDQKRDREYFGGNRKKTVGLADRKCQICKAFVRKGIASHHIFGRAADEKGKHLIALCKSCHDLVTRLGIRNSVNDPDFWEKLIHYSKLRKNGP